MCRLGAMSCDPSAISLLVQAAVAAFSVLAGMMMAEGGSEGSEALRSGVSDQEIAGRMSRGMAASFPEASFWAMVVFAMMLFL